MTPKQINQRRLTLSRRSEVIRDQLRQLQEDCPHENKSSIHDSDTGNWCKSDDKYWIDHRCFDCGKYWREYQ